MENQEKNTEIIGELFDTIQFTNEEDINSLFDNLSPEQVKYITTLALASAHRRGCLNLLESEMVSRLIRKL